MQDDIGILYIVATPIGNMEDITFRAIRVLKEVDIILCEDTRTTGKLLARYEIKNKLVSYNAHSTKEKEKFIIQSLSSGKNIALVSDAGTPSISDPGVLLVDSVYEYFGDDVRVVPIPGASALISAVSVSGIKGSGFNFLGFLPHKKGKETLLKKITLGEYVYVFYESSHRILKTLKSLNELLDEKREVVIAREITKKFEEIRRGNINTIYNYFNSNKNSQKGEFVVIVDKK